MIPDPASKTIAKKKLNSPLCLLATTFAYKILHKFADGVSQCRIQEMYFIKPKQLPAYITGHTYMGGMDRKAWARKQKNLQRQRGTICIKESYNGVKLSHQD